MYALNNQIEDDLAVLDEPKRINELIKSAIYIG